MPFQKQDPNVRNFKEPANLDGTSLLRGPKLFPAAPPQQPLRRHHQSRTQQQHELRVHRNSSPFNLNSLTPRTGTSNRAVDSRFADNAGNKGYRPLVANKRSEGLLEKTLHKPSFLQSTRKPSCDGRAAPLAITSSKTSKGNQDLVQIDVEGAGSEEEGEDTKVRSAGDECSPKTTDRLSPALSSPPSTDLIFKEEAHNRHAASTVFEQRVLFTDEAAVIIVEPEKPTHDLDTRPKPSVADDSVSFFDPTLTVKHSDVLVAERWATLEKQVNFHVDDLIPCNLPPNVSDYFQIMDSCVASNCDDAAERTETILLDILRLHKRGLSATRPDGACYSRVLKAYANVGNPAMVKSTLNLMYALVMEGDESALPNTKHYASLIHAWRKSGDEQAPEHCEAILKQVKEFHAADAALWCRPDLRIYTAIIHCWADSARAGAGASAELLFREMKSSYSAGEKELAPDTLVFSNLINAYLHSKDLHRAETLTWEMIDDFQQGNMKCRPTTIFLNTILKAVSAMDMPEKADEIIRLWLSKNETASLGANPDHFSYLHLLKCWANSDRSDAAEMAERTLAWLDFRSQHDDSAKLRTGMYNIVLKAHFKQGTWKKAGDLLVKMYHDFWNGNNDAKPDVWVFDKIVKGLCAAAMIDKADKLVRDLCRFRDASTGSPLYVGDDVNRICATVINIWCKSGRSGRPTFAEALLTHVHTSYCHDRYYPCPSRKLFVTVISALEQSRVPDRLIRIGQLQESLKLFSPRDGQYRPANRQASHHGARTSDSTGVTGKRNAQL